MNILLIRLRPDPETIGLQHVMLVEPLELEVLGATVPSADRTMVVDLALEWRPLRHFLKTFRPDVLGVTGYITSVPAMKAACREARRLNPATITVVGGVHCEVCPADLDDPSVDYRVVRNAAVVFPGLLEHIRRGAPLPPGILRVGERTDPTRLPAFDWSFPRPARHLVDRYRHRYFYIFHEHVALLKTAFGCPYRCSFCFCREITANHYHERPLGEVLDELAALPQSQIYIVDDDFLVTRERVEAFLEGLQRRDIRKNYLLYGRADFIAAHPDLLGRFRDQGLRTVIVGFESFVGSDLVGYSKGSSPETNVEAMKILNRLGLDCFATLILPPHWSVEDFETCGRRMRELGIRYVNLQPLTPLPGTGQAVDESRLLVPRADFTKWDLAHVMIRPEKMSVEAYYQQIIKLYMGTLYQLSDLLDYARRYPPRMWGKMLVGTGRVRRQYIEKMREARASDRRSAERS